MLGVLACQMLVLDICLGAKELARRPSPHSDMVHAFVWLGGMFACEFLPRRIFGIGCCLASTPFIVGVAFGI